MFNQAALQTSFIHALGHAGTVSPRAQRLFDRAVRTYQRKAVIAALTGRSRRLLALADVQAHVTIMHRYERGAQTVPLNVIRGSVDKTGDFDRDFYPAHERSEMRWVQVATAFVRGLDLPPVELVQVGSDYFVVDGHHRISVARVLNYTHIDAVVTVWEVARR